MEEAGTKRVMPAVLSEPSVLRLGSWAEIVEVDGFVAHE